MTKTGLHNRVKAFLNGAATWLKKFEDGRRLRTSPVMIAASLHQMAEEEDDPQVAPETLDLPEAVHARFREKAFLYREANVLLALMDRVSPSSDVRDPLFEPVLGEYYKSIIFEEYHLIPARTAGFFGEFLDHPIPREARRQSVLAALQDLKVRMRAPMGNKSDFARDWSRNWFASIGHNELDPARLEQLSLFWSDEYTAVQKMLEELEEIEFHEWQGSDEPQYGNVASLEAVKQAFRTAWDRIPAHKKRDR